jgi:hypothetical protein
MMDDPDARLEAAEPAHGPLVEARERPKPADARAPYHEVLDPDHADELLLCIGQGLALIEAPERHSPEQIVKSTAAYVDAVRSGARRLTRDPSDAALALACVYGHQICRELGWGWAHLRRTRSPGIVLVSPDFAYVTRPRRQIESALRDGGDALHQHYQRLRSLTKQSPDEFYVTVP